MAKFKVICLETGRNRATIEAVDYKEAEALANRKGYYIDADSLLVPFDEVIQPASQYIDDILNR